MKYDKYKDVFAEKISVHLKIPFLATTVKEFLINKLVKLTMLWSTGPRMLACISQSSR